MTEHRPKELSDALGGIGSIQVQESLVRAGSTLQLQFRLTLTKTLTLTLTLTQTLSLTPNSNPYP